MKTTVLTLLLTIGFLSAGAFANDAAPTTAKHQNITVVFKTNFAS